MSTVLVSIGNSDDKLSQKDWSEFWDDVDAEVQRLSETVFGTWVSDPVQEWQNAAWAFSLPDEQSRRRLRRNLAEIAREFRQDSIAWLEGETEFLEAARAD